MPFFSIVVPVYNVELFLGACLNTIIEQSFADFEVVLVDDGSTDKSSMICDSYCEIDNRITVIHKSNGGLVNARKAGLLATKGFYVLNIDSDDLVPIDLLERMYNIIQENNMPDVVAFDYQNITEDGTPKSTVKNAIKEGKYNRKDLEQLKSGFLYNIAEANYNYGSLIYSLWTKTIKRELALKWQMKTPEQLVKGEDVAVVFPMITHCESLYVARYVGYFYRSRLNSIVHTFNRYEIDSQRMLLGYLKEQNCGIPILNYAGYALRVFHSHLAKAAKALNTRKEFCSYCAQVYLTGWNDLIKPADGIRMALSRRLIYIAIIHQMWNVIWIFYKNTNKC